MPGIPKRTLYIGLGGTGKDILLRVRRWAFERFRTPVLPFTRFLWLDTDTKGTTPSDLDDPIDKRLGFGGHEKVSLALNLEELSAAFTGARISGSRTGGLTVRDWLPQELSEMQRSLQDGAGQIRSFGRLAFWYRATTFEKVVNLALDELMARDKVREAVVDMGYDDLHDDFDVVVVAGVSGGTGSGCFIDAGVLLRDLIEGQRRQKVNLRSVLVLPTVFMDMNLPSAEDDLLAANGYAALKELDYLMLPHSGTDTAESYEFPEMARNVNVTVPVFNMVHLIDSTTDSGQKFEDPRECFQVAADALTMELDRTDFAQQLRTTRSNQMQHISEPITARVAADDGTILSELPLHNRYAAFGQAQLVYDRDRLRNAAAYRLGALTLEFLLRDTNSDTLIQNTRDDLKNEQIVGLTEDHILSHLMRDRGGKDMLDQIRREIESKVAEAFKPVERALADLVGGAGDSSGGPFKALKKTEKAIGEIEGKLGSFRRDLESRASDALQSEGDKARRGDAFETIQSNKSKALEVVVEKIQKNMHEKLADPVQYGLSAARLLLEEAKLECERIVSGQETDEAPGEPDKPRLSRLGGLVDAQERMMEAEGIPGFPPPFKSLAIAQASSQLRREIDQHEVDLRKAVDEYKREWQASISAAANREYMSLAREAITWVVENLKEKVGDETKIKKDGDEFELKRTGFMHALGEYEQRLRDLRDDQNAMANAFRDALRPSRHVYMDEDASEDDLLFSHCLLASSQAADDEDLRREALVKTLAEFFDKSAFVDRAALDQMEADEIKQASLIQMGMKVMVERAQNYHQNKQPWEEVQEKLETFCFEKTEVIADDESLEASSVLNNRGQEHIVEAKRRMVDNTAPSLKLASGQWEGLKEKRITLLGGSTNGTQMVEEWFTSGGQSTPTSARNDRGSVIAYQEYYCVPVVLVRCLSNLKEHYNRELAKDPKRPFMRHSDARWLRFPDIVIRNEQKYWLERNAQMTRLLRALLMGVVEFNDQKHQWTVHLHQMGQIREAAMGYTIELAVDNLLADEGLAEEVHRKVQEAEAALMAPSAQDRLFAFGAAIRHLLFNVYPQSDHSGMKRPQGPETLAAFGMYKDIVYGKICSALGHEAWSDDKPLPDTVNHRLDDADGTLVEIPYRDQRMLTEIKRLT
jgi:hypothetical protein